MRRGFFSRFIGLLVKGGLVMILWNLLVPELFGGPMIRFMQAVLLVVLGHLLTGGFGRARHRRRKWRAKLEKLMKETEDRMSPEEREKFRKGFTSGKWEVNVVEVEDEPEEENEEEPDSDDEQER
ncbi:MAG: hypothetical protein AAF587_19005 [Bacteroidota bacterium]